MRTSLIFGIVALTFGAMALGGALSDSPIVSGGFGLAAGIMGLAAGIINGKDGGLQPTGNATRAEFATILMRYAKL